MLYIESTVTFDRKDEIKLVSFVILVHNLWQYKSNFVHRFYMIKFQLEMIFFFCKHLNQNSNFQLVFFL